MSERLQKYMARSGVASRRASEQLIEQGRVFVNGHEVTRLGTTVDPQRDTVTVDGRIIRPASEFHYILLNKPAGYVTTVRDPGGRPTVMQLVADVGDRIYPVGRLDAASEGLLLLTNDGDLANQLLHPRYEVPKRYRATVRGNVTKAVLGRLASGVQLEDGPTAPARARLIRQSSNESVLELTLVEGRNRQVRRMCAAVGHPVLHLERIAFGPIRMGRLQRGRYRRLSAGEVGQLRRAASRAQN